MIRGPPRELTGGNRGGWPQGDINVKGRCRGAKSVEVKSDDGMEPIVTATRSAATTTTTRGATATAEVGTAAVASATGAAKAAKPEHMIAESTSPRNA